jgi:hypothetical protein
VQEHIAAEAGAEMETALAPLHQADAELDAELLAPRWQQRRQRRWRRRECAELLAHQIVRQPRVPFLAPTPDPCSPCCCSSDRRPEGLELEPEPEPELESEPEPEPETEPEPEPEPKPEPEPEPPAQWDTLDMGKAVYVRFDKHTWFGHDQLLTRHIRRLKPAPVTLATPSASVPPTTPKPSVTVTLVLEVTPATFSQGKQTSEQAISSKCIE